MKRSQIETETIFELCLHDFGNLSYQLLDVQSTGEQLYKLAGKMNFLFCQAGQGKQFEAIVHRVEQEVISE